jgi:hypothetical protein
MSSATPPPPAAPSAGGPGRRGAAYTLFAGLAALFSIGTIVQFFLAGAGAFGAKDEGYEKAGSFDPHAAVGSILTVVALLLLIAAAVARPSRNLVIASGLIFVLMILQNVLGATGADARWVTGALHPVNGLIITGLGGYVASKAFARDAARDIPPAAPRAR